jgi:hypothetical protein
MLGDVRDPQNIRPVRPERPCHEVFSERDGVLLRTPPALASGEPLKACSGHQTGDTLAVDRPPNSEPQLRSDPRHAVGPPRRRMDLTDRRGQLDVGDHPRRRVRLAGPPRVIPGTRHAQTLTHERDRERGLLRIDERERHFRARTFSVAKKAAARESRSRSIRSTRVCPDFG